MRKHFFPIFSRKSEKKCFSRCHHRYNDVLKWSMSLIPEYRQMKSVTSKIYVRATWLKYFICSLQYHIMSNVWKYMSLCQFSFMRNHLSGTFKWAFMFHILKIIGRFMRLIKNKYLNVKAHFHVFDKSINCDYAIFVCIVLKRRVPGSLLNFPLCKQVLECTVLKMDI